MNIHEQSPTTRRSLAQLIITIIVAALLLAIAGLLCIWLYVVIYTTPTEHRFPLDADVELTQDVAIELSRKALILDGKAKETMRPVAGWSDGETLFMRSKSNPQEGQVLWWVSRPEYTWEYSVTVRRNGGEIVCSITKPL
jgi:hypothetical protein